MTTTLSSIITGGKDSGISGSGKRAAYAMLSANSSSTWYGYVLYDDNFQMPVNYGNPTTYNQYGPSSVVYMNDSTYLYGSNAFFQGNGNQTQTYASSNGTGWYMNGTNSTGEFGNASIDIFSDGTFGRCERTSGSAYNKHYLNSSAINSDHSDKCNVYIIYNGVLRCVDRLYGAYNADKVGTTAYTISGLNSSMQGSASYNKARKELTVLNYTASSGSYNVLTYANVDFDTYPSPTAALTASGVTLTTAALTIPNWSTNDSESYYNLKPIVTNDGSLFISVMFQSSNFALFKVTRSGTTAITATRQATLTPTTSYGLPSGVPYGQRQITSKDGTSVATFCPYYYDGAGIQCYMVDKTNNTFTSYSNADSGYGYTCVPWKDSGWAFWYNGNCYASNYSGAYFTAVFNRGAGSLTQTNSSNIYMPQFTGPNTTNYPGYTQVTDYMLLPSTAYGVK